MDNPWSYFNNETRIRATFAKCNIMLGMLLFDNNTNIRAASRRNTGCCSDNDYLSTASRRNIAPGRSILPMTRAFAWRRADSHRQLRDYRESQRVFQLDSSYSRDMLDVRRRTVLGIERGILDAGHRSRVIAVTSRSCMCSYFSQSWWSET